MNEPGDKPKSKWERFWDQALEHKVFSGIAGTFLVLVVTGAIALTNSSGGSGSSATDPGVTVNTEPTTAETTEEEAPAEEEPETEEAPEVHGGVGLIRWAEREGHEVLLTENVYQEQATVDTITDPDGLVAALTESHRSGGITVFGNGTLQSIKGQVGIPSEPCSDGSAAYVSVRGPEGEQLWPENGRPKVVHREAVPFEANIAELNSVVLYAEAPLTEEGYCGSIIGPTQVGWVHLSVTR